MGIYVTRSKKKWLKLRVNISENKQRMGLKFCLAQFVMDMNLVLEYQKKSGDVKFFPRDLTWNYPYILETKQFLTLFFLLVQVNIVVLYP